MSTYGFIFCRSPRDHWVQRKVIYYIAVSAVSGFTDWQYSSMHFACEEYLLPLRSSPFMAVPCLRDSRFYTCIGRSFSSHERVELRRVGEA